MAGQTVTFGNPQLFARGECFRCLRTPCRSGVPRTAAGKNESLVDAGGKLPVIIIFVDTDEHVSRVLSKLKEMAAHRLIVRENVVLEQGNLD
jgi:PII-like signaling protein